jgi:anionic cell wall polymer biosynthesis LytR-Cps2A-Psr (LCP) family protein
MIWPSWVNKPFGAAALSFVFPGLGQIAAGDRRRGAIVAIPAIAIAVVLVGLVLFARHALLDNATNQSWLSSLMILNVVALIYHFWAMADAYFVAARNLPKEQRRRRQAGRQALKWTSVVAVVVLVSGPLFVHGVLAVEDASLQGAARCLNSPIPCWWLNSDEVAATDSGGAVNGNAADPTPPPPGQSNVAAASASDQPSGSIGPVASLQAPIVPSGQTTQNSANWNSDHMLNLLLVGMDSSPGRTDTLTDTMILLQVNTETGQSAMYGIARNMYCMPLPAAIAVHFPNDPATYACPKGRFTSPIGVNGEANALFYDAAFVHRDWYPGFPLSACDGKSGTDLSTCKLAQDWGRGTFALEQAVGALTGVSVDGTAVINLPGFAKLIDDLGGIDVNVPSYSSAVAGSGPVSDYPCGPKGTWAAAWHAGSVGNRICPLVHDGYTVSDGTGAAIPQMKADAARTGGLEKIFWQQGPNIAFTILPGQQHMDGEWALAYARSREYSSDYDRMARQQFVLRTIRTNVKPCSLLPKVVDPTNGILKDLGQLFWTDMPTDGSSLATLAGLAQDVTGDSVQHFSLDPNTLASPSGTTMIMDNGWAKAQSIVKHGLDKAPTSSASSGSSAKPAGGLGC